jgi:hypothetical protein
MYHIRNIHGTDNATNHWKLPKESRSLFSKRSTTIEP